MTPVTDFNAVANEICRLRSYALGRSLGAGSFKRAFLAHQSGQPIALKIAPITDSLRPRFQREADALRGCSHTAIASLVDSFAFSHSGHEYWVTVEEFLAGGTLAERRGSQTLEPTFVRGMGVTLAGALDHLHQRRLVHRDIKPANIMFRAGDDVVLTDFGIVRMLDAPTLTHAFLPQGPATPMYAAAEQLLNAKEQIDWRTDQFCLALVLAECLTGSPPFSPECDPNLAVARVSRRERLPGVSSSAIQAAGFGCLIKALEPWSVMRYRYPADFIAALSEG